MTATLLSEQLVPMAFDVVRETSIEDLATNPSILGKLAGRMAMTLAATVVADNVFESARSMGKEPTFTIFDAEHGASDDTLVLYYSGFNSAPAASAAVHRPATTKFGRFAVINEAPSGYNADATHAAISRLASSLGTKTIVTLGGSMGGSKFMPLEPRLRLDDGFEVFSIKDCSPTSIDTIKGSRVKMLEVLAALDRLHLHGGPGFRVIAESVGFVLENRNEAKKYRHALSHALGKALQSDLPTNRQCQRSGTFMLDHTSAPFVQAAPDIERKYLSPEDHSRDDIVNNSTSIRDLSDNATNSVENITSPYTGHANPCEQPTEYQQMDMTAFRSFGLLAAEERRATVHMST